MKRFIGLICTTTLIAAANLSAVVDIDDATIYAPAFTAAQEDAFHAASGISAVWDSWTGNDYSKLDFEKHFHTERNNFDAGPDDAGLVAKVAAGTKGIYFYFRVTDNTWTFPQDMAAANVFDFDAVDILIDSKPLTDILTSSKIEASGEYGITYTSQQFQLWLGEAGNVPTSLINNKVDELGKFEQNIIYSFEEMALEGVKVRVVQVDAVTKDMEMFLPWTKVGISDGTIDAGRRIGFCVGYNDRDAGGGESVAALRLKDHADPIGGLNGSAFAQRITYWGEVEFSTAVSTPVKSPVSAAGAVFKGEVVSSEFYTLKGEKLSTKAMADVGSHGLVVRRSVLKNGSVITSRVPMNR